MVKVWDKVTTLFGVGHRDETDSHYIKHQSAWYERRKRLLNRRCGHLASGVDYDDDLPSTRPPPPASHGDQVEREILPDRQSRDKRHIRIKMVSESRSLDQQHQPLGFKPHLASSSIDRVSMSKAKDDIRLPSSIVSTTAAKTTHAPIIRTTSDIDIHHTTKKPLYPQDLPHLDGGELSKASYYDSPDFDARESFVKLVNDVLSRHQPKRAYGMGLVGNLLSRKFRKDLTHAQLNAIYSFNDFRPYFTYWVTTVQILIMIITLFTYGFGPFGFSTSLMKDVVQDSTLAPRVESYLEVDNIWLGPPSSDLIHLGAKYTPCMRRDSQIYSEIILDRERERETGCCIQTHSKNCLQTEKRACSEEAVWLSWNESTAVAPVLTSPMTYSYYGNNNNNKTLQNHQQLRRRISGPVCGQDPQYCLRPASLHPHEWPDDITKWPICHEPSRAAETLHQMSCTVMGRPCCIGIYGQCRLTTSQHCQYLRGTFHPEATLCSQVSCMEDVCGLVPFYARDYPDQFYRLFTALFLHAGLIHLSFTVILQLYIMRDIERLLGSTRMAIIYIIPGVAGYLASATFVPYHTQVGPSGSQFALLACLVAETYNSWHLLDDPMRSLRELLWIAAGLFVLGLLPWIDNYAHIFGFMVGLMLSLALTPYLTPFNDAYSRRKKVIQIWVCIVLVIVTFVLLPLPLYIFPFKCSWCQYLDCWPLTPKWCENQGITVSRLNLSF